MRTYVAINKIFYNSRNVSDDDIYLYREMASFWLSFIPVGIN